ncbi:hypothetical protein [Georgenia faecalis]|uniref:Uncharacterized protein n=1 Tax=Georgenia faecalis TaxID=2483799 RepID=A0ABV9DCT7_9MICO|nr:hypothetical protein [Georgenia faecalis]
MTQPDTDPRSLLDTLPERDLAEHVEVFERVHDALAARLADTER